MRKALLFLFVWFAFVTVTEAQTLISSTTAYTEVIKPEASKSGRVRGLVIRPEVGLGAYSKGFVACANGTLSFQFNPYFSLGGGYGLDVLGGYGIRSSLYGNLRAYFCDRHWSPYYDLRLGTKSSSTLGLQVNGIDFSVSASLIFVRYYNYDEYYYYNSNHRLYFMTTFNIAYNIQLGKK